MDEVQVRGPLPEEGDPARCRGLTALGDRCTKWSLAGGHFCRWHVDQADPDAVLEVGEARARLLEASDGLLWVLARWLWSSGPPSAAAVWGGDLAESAQQAAARVVMDRSELRRLPAGDRVLLVELVASAVMALTARFVFEDGETPFHEPGWVADVVRDRARLPIAFTFAAETMANGRCQHFERSPLPVEALA